MAQRAREVQAITRGIFLSVHHDSVQEIYLENWTFEGKRHRFSNKYRGYSLFVSALNGAYEQSKTLAVSLGAMLRKSGFTPSYHHAEDIPGERRPVLDHAAGVFRYDNLAVLRNARIPALLFEAGVIVHQAEELDLQKPQTRSRLLEAALRGIETFCGRG